MVSGSIQFRQKYYAANAADRQEVGTGKILVGTETNWKPGIPQDSSWPSASRQPAR